MNIDIASFLLGFICIPSFRLLLFVLWLVRVGIHDAKGCKRPIKIFFYSVKETFFGYLTGLERVI